MTGFSFGGDQVRWLWLVPITEDERQFGKQEGPDALIDRLAGDGRSWVVGDRGPLPCTRHGRPPYGTRTTAVRDRERRHAGGTNAWKSSQTTGTVASSESSRSITPPCSGSRLPMSLMPRSRLIMDSMRSPSVAEHTAAAPTMHALPPGAVQQPRQQHGPDDHAGERRTADPSQVFFGLMVGRQLVPAEERPGEEPADVAGDRHRDEDQITRSGPSCGGQQQHRRTRPRNGTYAAGNTPAVASRTYPSWPCGQPPEQDGEHGQPEGGDERRRAPEVRCTAASRGRRPSPAPTGSGCRASRTPG